LGADTVNGRIQEFSSSGAYITQFGTFGSGHAQFLSPNGLAVDASGNVLVADNLSGIEEFTSSGAFIAQFGANGSENGQFGTPWGVAVDANLNVWVPDAIHNRIEEFSPVPEPTGLAMCLSASVSVFLVRRRRRQIEFGRSDVGSGERRKHRG